MDIFYFNVNEEKNPESEEFELLISTSTTNYSCITNGYILIFYFKIWQLVYCITFKDILYISDVIYELVVIRVIINVTGRAFGLLIFILVEISLVSTLLTHHFG